MFDRFLELFVTFYNPNGSIEHKLHSVILTNISFNLFLEAFMGFAPLYVHYDGGILAYYYALFKLPRYGRLFEMDA